MINRKNISRLIVIFLISYFIFPLLTLAKAAKITNTTLWNASLKSNAGNLGYGNGKYNTKGYSNNPRELKYIGGFFDNTNNWRVFCIEPGAHFNNNATHTFSTVNTKIPSLSNGWKISKDTETELRKVMSCWYTANNLKTNHNMDDTTAAQNNSAYVIATQAIVWELVTGERTSIGATSILGGDYKPNKKVTGSLYDQIAKRTGVFNAYKSILRCSARYEIGGPNGVPNWATISSLKGTNKQPLNYDSKTGKYTATFSHNASLAKTTLYNYYTFGINGKTANCKAGATVGNITCKCNGEKCIFTSSKPIDVSNTAKITFKYSYKDDAKSALNTVPTYYYSGNDGGALQKVMSGSLPHEYYLYLYTPQYQLKVNKVDEAKKPLSGINFDIYKGNCDSASNKIGTITTNTSGVATYNKISSVGDYCLRETNTPDGYSPAKDTKITVKKEHIVGSKTYATVTIENKKTSLNMDKYTIKDGQRVKLKDDYCTKTVCEEENNRENGPIFEITKDGKKVCVTNEKAGVEDGKYVFSSLSETCASGTTNKIKTCEGVFSILGIPAGKYTVTETAAACGTTLPENASMTVEVKAGSNTSVTMENGVSGIVFHKKNENGILLDGGKYTLQKKEDGIYKDILLKNVSGMEYTYSSDLTEETGTYLLSTIGGVLNVKQLPVGDYRFVEKEAPSGYTAIQDKDSTATFTINDKYAKNDEYQNVSLINRKNKVEGSNDSAELLVTIITGRRVINYVLIITSLAALLIILLLLRRKYKK